MFSSWIGTAEEFILLMALDMRLGVR